MLIRSRDRIFPDHVIGDCWPIATYHHDLAAATLDLLHQISGTQHLGREMVQTGDRLATDGLKSKNDEASVFFR